ncbi:hypothetical protein BD779DRAFT_1530418 [Infundibulicybe gibba]|nr:hypothetical protein BD779DRAFT_1530418 [Infundibulicybe gibba]
MNIPVEIIQKIFLELCSSETEFPLSHNPLEPRLVLTHVSSQWRAIALAMPELWNNIVVRPPGNREVPGLCDPIRAWLCRSLPSTFSFHAINSTPSNMYHLFDLIFPIAHRCLKLILDLEGETLCQLVSLPPGLLNSLQDLMLVVWAISDDDKLLVTELHQTITTFQSCPQLENITFDFFETPIDITLFEFPWAQLSRLIIHSDIGIPTTHCFHMLQQTVHLQLCDLDVSPIDNADLKIIIPLSHRPISLLWLHTLRLCFSTLDHISHFLAGLHLPNLRKIKPSTGDGELWPLPTFQSFLADLFATIQSLDLTDVTEFNNLTETIALFPNIEVLSFDNTEPIPSETLRALGDGAIGARLTMLVFGMIEPARLLDLLEARVAATYAAGTNVTNFSFVLALCDLSGPEDSVRANALLRTGVVIQAEIPEELG